MAICTVLATLRSLPAAEIASTDYFPQPTVYFKPALERAFHIDPYLPRPASLRRGSLHYPCLTAGI